MVTANEPAPVATVETEQPVEPVMKEDVVVPFVAPPPTPQKIPEPQPQSQPQQVTSEIETDMVQEFHARPETPVVAPSPVTIRAPKTGAWGAPETPVKEIPQSTQPATIATVAEEIQPIPIQSTTTTEVVEEFVTPAITPSVPSSTTAWTAPTATTTSKSARKQTPNACMFTIQELYVCVLMVGRPDITAIPLHNN